MRVIYLDTPYDDRLIASGIPSLCSYLEHLCQNFVSSVAVDSEHRLHKHLPKRKSDTGRHSSRLKDIPLVYTNYRVTKNSLFSKYVD